MLIPRQLWGFSRYSGTSLCPATATTRNFMRLPWGWGMCQVLFYFIRLSPFVLTHSPVPFRPPPPFVLPFVSLFCVIVNDYESTITNRIPWRLVLYYLITTHSQPKLGATHFCLAFLCCKFWLNYFKYHPNERMRSDNGSRQKNNPNAAYL